MDSGKTVNKHMHEQFVCWSMCIYIKLLYLRYILSIHNLSVFIWEREPGQSCTADITYTHFSGFSVINEKEGSLIYQLYKMETFANVSTECSVITFTLELLVETLAKVSSNFKLVSENL